MRISMAACSTHEEKSSLRIHGICGCGGGDAQCERSRDGALAGVVDLSTDRAKKAPHLTKLPPKVPWRGT